MNTGEDKLRGDNWPQRVFYFYVDGFRAMTLGRTLWLIIALKVIIFFVIVRFIFFPDFLASKADTDQLKADYVRHELLDEQQAASSEQQVQVSRDAVSGQPITNNKK